MSDVEDVRHALMMRDAGYDPPPCWEQIGELLKDHDRLRAALTASEDRCQAAGVSDGNLIGSLKAALAEARKELGQAADAVLDHSRALAEAERERDAAKHHSDVVEEVLLMRTKDLFPDLRARAEHAEADLVDTKDDCLRLHKDKMDLFEENIVIKADFAAAREVIERFYRAAKVGNIYGRSMPISLAMDNASAFLERTATAAAATEAAKPTP